MLKGLNHITIVVSDLDRSLHFYTHILGFTAHVKWQGGAYLTLGELWFCLSCDIPCAKRDYTHIAFDIVANDFEEFVTKLRSFNVTEWKDNSSEGQSCYILDPDENKLEIHVGDIQSRLKILKLQPYKGLVWL